jgi:uncharacterized membrane protein
MRARRSLVRDTGLIFIGGLSLGAGLMYIFDPDYGARRRAKLRDKTNHALHVARKGIDKATRDLQHRSRGFGASMRGLFRSRRAGIVGPEDDTVLVERVRAELGRHIRRPHAVEVKANDHLVLLRGRIPEHELAEVLRAVRRVRGVTRVENQLEPDREEAAIGERVLIRSSAWSPAARLIGSIAGAALFVFGLFRRGGVGIGAATAGALLGVRAATNLPPRQILGIGEQQAIDIRKTLTVDVPVGEVYRFWSRLENFPRFMEHVKAVQIVDSRRSHWTASGPAGLPVEFDAEVTALEPNRLFAWRTLPGSSFEHAGEVRFEPAPGESTRVDIRMRWVPKSGALGHALASLFHKDPKAALDDDLVRMKSLLEDGRTSAHGARVSLEELNGS